jgi:hypothetical protein
MWKESNMISAGSTNSVNWRKEREFLVSLVLTGGKMRALAIKKSQNLYDVRSNRFTFTELGRKIIRTRSKCKTPAADYGWPKIII